MNRCTGGAHTGLLAPVLALMLSAMLPQSIAAGAQTPQPFPRGPQPPRPASPAPQSPSAPQPAAAPAPLPAGTEKPTDPGVPTDAQLGMPVHPQAQFITSYDAGRGQRYYLFGCSASFAEVVAYYKVALKEKGNVVFEQPATHTFEVGKFREETMGFPPGVTVKDYTTGGSAGYPNPKRGTAPERFPTIIQIVPMPVGAQATAPRR